MWINKFGSWSAGFSWSQLIWIYTRVQLIDPVCLLWLSHWLNVDLNLHWVSETCMRASKGKHLEFLHYIISIFLTGLLESNADENSPNPSPSVTSKTARPSLAKIILSQDSDVAKQLALSHVLTALQITYARYGNVSKISNTFLFLFSNKMLIFRARIHKMLVRIANSADPDQTASALFV